MACSLQHPYEQNTTIELDALLDLIDYEMEIFREEGSDDVGQGIRLLNDITYRLTCPQDKAAFTTAAIDRYVGE